MPVIASVTAHVSNRDGSAASPTAPLNLYNEPFDVGFGLTITTAFSSASAPSVTVQHTFDNIMAGASARYFDHSSVSGVSVGRPVDGSYTEPVAGIRVVTAGSSNAANVSGQAATLRIIQSGF